MNHEIDNDYKQELKLNISIIGNKIKDIEKENEKLLEILSKNFELLKELKNDIKKITNIIDNLECKNENINNKIENKDSTTKKENSEENKNVAYGNQINISDKYKSKKFHYLKINEEIETELFNLMKKSIVKSEVSLSERGGFERKEVDSENKKVCFKISQQLTNYKRKENNYLAKKALFLKNVGCLVRFSHEIGILIFQILLEIFKEQVGFHSLIEERIRLYFSTWVKKILDENCYKKISKIDKILEQIKNIIEYENRGEKENSFLIKDLFPDLCKLYFHCYLTDIIINIIYAKQNEEFNWDTMRDELLTNLDNKKVLFTYLPGLNCNGKFFDNSQIYVVTYSIENPDKLQIGKPSFFEIEEKIEINSINKIKEIKFEYKKTGRTDIQKGKKMIEIEFQVNLGIDMPKWDYPKFSFKFLDCNNYVLNNTNLIVLEQANYQKCICQMIINGKVFKESEPIIVDLSQK